ncbi:BZ3500_MvSof-1268-A1-R1_Chr4-4g07467 [Microbotryum saponariae]|uniref:BZ3500_MvSof-1268-A1-R1_Chr4-4g07467 protein n=1 Tax=Microbotryum saponariae TaxID=289078 RepID=A0A2X0LCB1_9BASI|nr:BZ3500_MvSof-1268-A1-R1_Chr4-4g07467 [Microbotryum saponariae]SDA07128.1 BZ3501_MvSof-1269-A2-R1_Chr4-3g07175 [Microbotryum saponariae]
MTTQLDDSTSPALRGDNATSSQPLKPDGESSTVTLTKKEYDELGSENFWEWDRNMLYLAPREVYTFTKHGTIPDTWTQDVRAKWEHYARMIILASITDPALHMLLAMDPDATAHDWWVAFRERYAPNDALATISLVDKFCNMPGMPSDHAGFLEWSKRTLNLATHIRKNEIDVEQLMAARLLANVPPALEPWRSAVIRRLEPGQKRLPSFEDLLWSLRRHLDTPCQFCFSREHMANQCPGREQRTNHVEHKASSNGRRKKTN